MRQGDKLMSDDEVWEEIARVAEDLYGQYLDLNELDLLDAIPHLSEQPDVDRNWDVPIGISVTGDADDAELVEAGSTMKYVSMHENDGSLG